MSTGSAPAGPNSDPTSGGAATLARVGAALAELSQGEGLDLQALFRRVMAGESLGRALGLPPQVVDLLYAQAFAAHEAGRGLAALQMFQALTVLAPGVKDHWLGLAICLRGQDQPGAAALALDTALSLDPSDPATRFHRIDLACHRGDWATARAELMAYDAQPARPGASAVAAEVQRLRGLIQRKAG